MFNKRLLRLLPSTRAPLVGAVVFAVLAALAEAGAFVQVAKVLEQVVEASSLAGEWMAPVRIALLLAAAFFAFTFLSRWLAGCVAARARRTTSQLIYDKLVALGAPYALSTRPSESAQLFGEGAEALAAYVSRYVPQFFCAVAVPVALAFVVGTVSVPAALAMLVFVFCMPVAIMRFMKHAKERAGEQWNSYTNLGSAFHDAISGLATLKVFGSDAQAQWALDDKAEFFRTTTMRLLHVQLNSITIMDLFTYCGIALGAGVALIQLQVGALSVHQAFTVLLLAPLLFGPMRTFGSLFHTGMNGEDVAASLFDLLDAPEPTPGGKKCASPQPDIVLDGVAYAYDGEHPAVSGVSMSVPANSIVGITGESGAGKSTLARVLCGLAAPYVGSATIGGVEVRDLAPENLASLVTMVSRQSHLFKGTVRSNLALGDSTVPDAYLWDVLRRARIADEVVAAGGLDAEVAEGGANFSGGQRQRLCFARAIVRDTPIYIFDEAASNVDAESEKLLYDIMHEIAFDKTVLVISHRLRMLAWTDEVFVMEEGRIVEHGQHAQLVQQEGAYRNLWERHAMLEDFAARIGADDDAPQPEPTRAQEVIANLPGMAASAMQAVIDARQLQGYVDSSSAAGPVGHPAWIPLPDSVTALADQPTEKGASGKAEPEDRPEQDRPSRSLAETVRGLMRLTVPMRSDFREALFAASASNIAVVALAGFAACATLSACGLMSPATFAVGLVGMVLCALARGPLHYGERLYTHDQTFKTLALVRSRVFEAMRALAPAKLSGRGTGDLVSLVTSDVELLEGFYSRTLTPVASALLCSLAASVLVCFASPLLGAALLCCCAVAAIALPLTLERATRERGSSLRAFSVAMSSYVYDSLEGFSDLVLLGRAHEYAEEMRAHFATMAAGEVRDAARAAAFGAVASFAVLVLQVGFSAIVWFSVSAHLAGSAMAAVAGVVGVVFVGNLADVAGLGAGLHQTHAAASRILDLIDEDPAVTEVRDGAKPEQFSGATTDSVEFGYGAEPVLSGLSVSVEAGQFVRVAGSSGSGKTTLLSLFMRFWDPWSGSVRVSDTDLRSLSSSHLRTLESFMAQDTYLFADTLRGNILVANRSATAEDVDAAVAAAALSDVVERLDQGLDTMLGQGAVQLSDGERQRVGLARAFLHDGPFMLLDEPTSNLDAINEAAILYSLAANTQGKTVLCASHRPTIAALSDATIWLGPASSPDGKADKADSPE